MNKYTYKQHASLYCDTVGDQRDLTVNGKLIYQQCIKPSDFKGGGCWIDI